MTDLGAPGAPAAVIEGAGSTDALGTAVAPAGDVDGDGFADVAIAAPGAGTNDRGAVYVLRDLHTAQVLDLSLGLAATAGYELVRAHAFKPNEQHGFISSQKEGMQVFAGIDPAAMGRVRVLDA